MSVSYSSNDFGHSAATGLSPQTTASVTTLAAAQAALRPQALAVASSHEGVSYGEMERRANQLANYLRAVGVGPNAVVGLLLERSPSLVISALAIMKAGAAYMPLDPVHPAERLAFMLRDAGAAALVTTSVLAARMAGQSPQCRTVCLDADADSIAKQAESWSGAAPAGSDLAYVIYTSGSTGQPKGVEVTHANLLNLVRWHQRAFSVSPDDRATSVAALGFDAAVWELWPYLTGGASLHVADDQVRNDPRSLRDWMVERRITISFVPTIIAENLLQLEWPASTALRYLLTGADTLKRYPSPSLPFRLVNNYGPTECTVVTTSGIVPASGRPQAPTIGSAIDNTELYVLDRDREPVPPGEAGELYVGGANVARGYRNHPDLTAQSFVPNPFRKNSDSRLYKTGDLVKRLPNGEFAFLGRADEQVKIRGYRVEPNEVAVALESHPDVKASVVIPREDEHGERELVAYLVFAPQAELSAGALRDYLRLRVPDYMVPSAFVPLPSLPLTANGKVDRAALPGVEGKLRAESFVAPETEVERQLAGILAPLLKLDRVGIHDNFFLLGGHSLLGTQLIARVSEAFGVELTLLKLFDNPTVAQMSAEIEKLILERIESMSETEDSGERSRIVA